MLVFYSHKNVKYKNNVSLLHKNSSFKDERQSMASRKEHLFDSTIDLEKNNIYHTGLAAILIKKSHVVQKCRSKTL